MGWQEFTVEMKDNSEEVYRSIYVSHFCKTWLPPTLYALPGLSPN